MDAPPVRSANGRGRPEAAAWRKMQCGRAATAERALAAVAVWRGAWPCAGQRVHRYGSVGRRLVSFCSPGSRFLVQRVAGGQERGS